MTCSRCHSHEASVFVKQILQNKVTELSLCPPCAQEEGIAPAPGAASLSLLFGDAAARGAAAAPRLACPACGLRYAEFRESGLLGCASCYEAFAQPLAHVLKRVHGSLRHGGKRPGGAPGEARRVQERLSAAVAAEDYEAAARLRDQLRRLEA